MTRPEIAFAALSEMEISLDAAEDERTRLCRALHDSTGQLLLSLSLSFARFKEASHSRKLDPLLTEMSETIGEIFREIRDFCFMEYPADLESEGLSRALEAFAKEMARRTGLRIEVQSGVGKDDVEAEVALALLRIGQEALVNVHRHAKASKVVVEISRQGESVELRISDDGRGMPHSKTVEPHHGVGLIGMRDRARGLGGSFAVRRLSPGTMIVATMPIAAERKRDRALVPNEALFHA